MRRKNLVVLLGASLLTLMVGLFLNRGPHYGIPLEMDYEIGRPGFQSSYELEIKERQTYAVQVWFLQDENISEIDSEKIYKVLKSTPGNGGYNFPATFKVSLYKGNVKHKILQQVVENPETNSGGAGRYASLVDVKLEPGKYLLSVKILGVSQEVIELPAKMEVNFSHHGK